MLLDDRGPILECQWSSDCVWDLRPEHLHWCACLSAASFPIAHCVFHGCRLLTKFWWHPAHGVGASHGRSPFNGTMVPGSCTTRSLARRRAGLTWRIIEGAQVSYKMNWKLLPLLCCVCCSSNSMNDADAAIRGVMAEQEAAWDRGDIPAFMAGYSDTICFISKKGKTCSKAAVTANYLKTYPDKRIMGDLQFGIHEIVMAGTDNAWLTGTWELYRAADTLGGGFSLLWAKEQVGWRIVRDHTY